MHLTRQPQPRRPLAHRQQGLSGLSILVIILVAILFATCAIKLTPVYLESLTVKTSVEKVVELVESGELKRAGIKGKLSKLFDVNRVEGIIARDVKVTSEKGVITIDASYHAQVPLFSNIDVVLKFDHLVFEATSAKNN